MNAILHRRRPAGRQDGERGAILIIATIGIVLAVVSAALAVDLGRQAQEARRNQKVADLAALDAVRALPNDPTGAAQQSATRNEFDYTAPGNQLTVEPGNIDASRNFVPGPLGTANAVRVTARSIVRGGFLPGDQSVLRRAVAAMGTSTPIGTVRVGSKMATVSSTERTILNRLLNQTVGGSHPVDAVGWKGLADANVSFERLRTALNLTTGSADQVLDTQLTFRRLLEATVTALNADGTPSSAAAITPLTSIATNVAASGGGQVTLRDLFDIAGNAGNGSDVANATINVLDIVRGGAIVADGNHFASMDLTASEIGPIPGLNFARVKFGLIEPPQQETGPPKDELGNYRTVARTSQARVLVELHLQLPLTGLGLVDVTVPYYLDAGSAEALLDSLNCSSGGDKPASVDILGRTTAGTSSVGTVSDAALGTEVPVPSPTGATLVNVVGLVTVSTTGAITTTIPGNSGTMLTFTPEYTPDAASKPVPGTQLSVPLLTSANVNVSVVGLLDANAIKLDVINGVNNAVPGLTSNLLDPIYRSLGLAFAGADVWAPPVQTCQAVNFVPSPPPPPGSGVPVLVV